MVRANAALASSVTEAIVFIAADPRECAPWVAKWTAVQKLALPIQWAREGTWRGWRMIAIANGAGIDRAYRAAKSMEAAAQFWNIGFGGAADPALKIGDVVAATCVRVETEMFRCEQPRTSAAFRTGVVETIPRVAQSALEKRNYFARGASVIEMEAAGIARAASEIGVPFYCVRAISDLATEDFSNDFNAALGPDGKFSASRLVAGALRNPIGRFGELIRLQQRTRIAAQYLGEFLADCEF